MTTAEIVQCSIQALSAILLAGGLFYTGYQVRLARKIHVQNHDWNRRCAAQQAIMNFSSTVVGTDRLDKELNYLTCTKPIPLSTIEKAFGADPELRVICHRLLNFNESLAIGIIQGIYDEQIIEAAWTGNMHRVFSSFHNYVQDLRNNGRPNAFLEQQAIIRRWDSRSNPVSLRPVSTDE